MRLVNIVSPDIKTAKYFNDNSKDITSLHQYIQYVMLSMVS